MTAMEWVLKLHGLGYLPHSTEKSGYPTRSEVRRWFDRKSIEIDGEVALSDDPMCFPVQSVVFFPKSDRKVTLW